MTITPQAIGIIGCGDICRKAYLPGAAHYAITEVVAVADLDVDRARSVAAEHGVAKGCSVEKLLADPQIVLVENLTIPKVHAEINRAILAAGKHVYCEKPFALSLAEAAPLVEMAAARNLRISSAPDTFLGHGLQTCRRTVDEGAIGTVVGGVMHMACPGHESWHPSPAFYYQAGGGPLFDMGPYYITALVSILGPVRRVCGIARKGREEREITSQPLAGTRIPVEVPTHICGVLDFACGAAVNLIMSFDVFGHHLPRLELYGTEGSLSLPDPNHFVGPVSLKRGRDDWQETPCPGPEHRRGAGAADLLHAVAAKRPHRADGALAVHVVEVMEALVTAGTEHRVVDLTTTCQRPEAVQVDGPEDGF